MIDDTALYAAAMKNHLALSGVGFEIRCAHRPGDPEDQPSWSCARFRFGADYPEEEFFGATAASEYNAVLKFYRAVRVVGLLIGEPDEILDDLGDEVNA